MKKDLTHKQLAKKIGSYSALAAAFMSTANVAHAAAVYTDVNPDAVITVGNTVSFDIDGDGTNDYDVFASTFFGSSYVAITAAPNPVVGTSLYNVYKLNLLDPIDGASPLFNQVGFAPLLYSGGQGNYPPGSGPGYVGLSFDIGGNNHFGWMEVEVVTAGQAIVYAHGYNDTPDEVSLAGDPGAANCVPGGPLGVPTMSQWGLITFALMMLSFGTIAIGRKKRIMPDGTTVDMGIAHEFRNPPFSAKHFKKATLLTLGLIGLATTGTLLAYGSIALVDVIGFSVASPIFAYLAHLTMKQNEEWKNNK